MRRMFLGNIEVRARPGHRTQGLMQAGPLSLPVALGRGGIKADKREGDGGTPRGRFRPLRLWWRADRLRHPRTLLPTRRITREAAWSEDPSDRNYNRPVIRSANEPGDRLWRSDGLYDLFIEIDHNVRPRGCWPRQRGFHPRGAARLCPDGRLRSAAIRRSPPIVTADRAKDENHDSLLALS